MRMIYGNAELQIVRTLDILKEDLYTPDMQQYLKSRWYYECLAYFNPSATAYKRFIDAGGAGVDLNVAFPGANPAETHDAIRRLLSAPRQKLYLLLEGPPLGQALGTPTVLLESPGKDRRGNDYPCDFNGGPFPRVLGIKQITGSKTFLVHFGIETYVNECGAVLPASDPAVPRPIVSNRYRMYTDTDGDHYSVRHIEGTVVFRADVLHHLQDALGGPITPDLFRHQFFHPIPDYFHRAGIHVEAVEDGYTIRYHVIDKEMPLNIVQSVLGITRIEAYEIDSGLLPSPDEQFGNAAMDLMGDILGSGFGNLTPGRMLLRPLQGARNSLPSFYQTWVINVWGNRLAARRDLMWVALNILSSRGRINALLFVPELQFLLMRDLVGKHVRAVVNLRRGPGLINYGKMIGTAFSLNADPEEIRADAAGDGRLLITPSQHPNPPPPFSCGTRGTYLEEVVAAALQAPCTAVTQPQNRAFRFDATEDIVS